MTCQFLYDSVSKGLNLMPCEISWGPDLSKDGISISTGCEQPGGLSDAEIAVPSLVRGQNTSIFQTFNVFL